MELRAYGFVARNLSDKAIGIQFGHAMVRLSTMNQPNFIEFANNHETFVILNGGTTNTSKENPGELNQLLHSIKNLNVTKVAAFYEPDLGNQLTAISFIVDERVWNHNKYPMFDGYMRNLDPNMARTYFGNGNPMNSLEVEYKELFKEYLESIGGIENYTLKQILYNARTI